MNTPRAHLSTASPAVEFAATAVTRVATDQTGARTSATNSG